MILTLKNFFYKCYPMIILFIITTLTTVIGIIERVNGPFSLVWLTNAITIGVLLRFYQHVNWRHYLICCAGMVLPDLLIGTHLNQVLLMTIANIVTISIGYITLHRFATRTEEDEWLGSLHSVPQWLLLCQPSLIIGSLVGSGALFALYGNAFFQTAFYWYLNESLDFIVFLPVILAAPKILKSFENDFLNAFLHIIPSILLLFAFIFITDKIYFLMASILIIPTIIWLALSGNLFLTTFGISMNGAFFFMWIIHSTHGYLHFSENIYISAVRTIVAVLALCALTIAVAISERDKLFSKLSQLANHDDLTGILNRRAFTKAAEAITSSLKKGDICSMVLIDIDFFKKINDVWGHQKGDKVLVAFCQRLKQFIPDSQLFGRVGGEEFALLLANTPKINHQELTNTIVNELSRNPLSIDNEPFPLTISAGMAVWSEEQKYETLFKYADLASYQAKNNGRNQWQKYLPCENMNPNSNFTPSLL